MWRYKAWWDLAHASYRPTSVVRKGKPQRWARAEEEIRSVRPTGRKAVLKANAP